MKPDFALDFRDNQIALLHRQEGAWAIIGRVAMDDPDLDAAMAYLRATALGLSPRGVASKLILPNEAILYTELANLPFNPAQRAAAIAKGLAGRTPYDVADLVYDWTDAGASAHVAVIARETLDEAEGFATQHRFNPVSFAALPDQGGFEGEVWFGATKLSETLLAGGEVVERDDVTLLAPEAPSAAAVAEASDFVMGAGAEPVADEPEVEVAAEPEVEAAEAPVPLPEPEPEPLPAPEPEPAPEVEAAAAPEPRREVWQDFIADVPEPAPAAPEPEAAGAAIAAESAPQDPPASFEAAMQEAPEETIELAEVEVAEVEEAPMAVDVPLIDDMPPPDTFGEKPQSRAEKMLAAFAARRAAALAKAEADTNARVEPVLRAAKGAEAQASLPLDDVAKDVPAAPLPEPASEPAASAAPASDQPESSAVAAGTPNPPKLGAAEGKLGRAADLARPTALTPPVVQHIPAKPLPPKPQNLKSMPKAKAAKAGNAWLGWILTAVLLLSLMAAAALSSYMLDAFNTLFPSTTAVATAQPETAPAPAASNDTTAGLTLSTSNAPAAASQTVAPAVQAPAVVTSDQTTAQPAPLAQTLPPATTPELSLPVLAAAATTPTPSVPTPPAPATPVAAPAVAPAPATAPEVTRAATSTSLAANIVPVISGRPAVVPQPRPAAILASASRALPNAETAFADPELAGKKPLARPASVLAAAASAAPAPAADPTLANARPLPRPADILAAGRAARLASAPASLVASATAAAAEAALAPMAIDPNRSPLAVSASLLPAARPKGLKSDFDQALAAAAAAPDPAPEAAPDQVASAAPADASVEDEVGLDGGTAERTVVSKQATQRNMLNLNNVNLVGIFGSNANRYALIRQPNGRFKKLKIGDRFDGGQVAAITESEVRYAKDGEMLALRMPKT